MSMNTRILELRREFNLSQQQLAQATGVSQSTIAKIEKCRNEATASTIRKLCDFFNVSADYLIERTDELGSVVMPAPTAPQLSAEDKNLLSAYHGLERPLQSLLWDMIRTWQKNSASSSEEAPKKKA